MIGLIALIADLKKANGIELTTKNANARNAELSISLKQNKAKPKENEHI